MTEPYDFEADGSWRPRHVDWSAFTAYSAEDFELAEAIRAAVREILASGMAPDCPEGWCLAAKRGFEEHNPNKDGFDEEIHHSCFCLLRPDGGFVQIRETKKDYYDFRSGCRHWCTSDGAEAPCTAEDIALELDFDAYASNRDGNTNHCRTIRDSSVFHDGTSANIRRLFPQRGMGLLKALEEIADPTGEKSEARVAFITFRRDREQKEEQPQEKEAVKGQDNGKRKETRDQAAQRGQSATGEEQRREETVRKLADMRETLRKQGSRLIVSRSVVMLTNLGPESRYGVIPSEEEIRQGRRISVKALTMHPILDVWFFVPETGFMVTTPDREYTVDCRTAAVKSRRLTILDRPLTGRDGRPEKSDSFALPMEREGYLSRGAELVSGRIRLFAEKRTYGLFGSKSVYAWLSVPGVRVPEDKRFVDAAMAPTHVVGLLEDGMAVASPYHPVDVFIADDYGQYDVGAWTDVVRVYACSYGTIGLSRDGTVLYTGKKHRWAASLGGWRDVVDVFADELYAIALTDDGRILTSDGAPRELTRWTDIVAIACSDRWCAGLREDGNVLICGRFGADTIVFGASPGLA